MLRARLNGVFVLGIDAENVRRLQAGQPINVDLAELGGQGEILLMYGNTMADIAKELEQVTGQPLPIPMPFTTVEQ